MTLCFGAARHGILFLFSLYPFAYQNLLARLPARWESKLQQHIHPDDLAPALALLFDPPPWTLVAGRPECSWWARRAGCNCQEPEVTVPCCCTAVPLDSVGSPRASRPACLPVHTHVPDSLPAACTWHLLIPNNGLRCAGAWCSHAATAHSLPCPALQAAAACIPLILYIYRRSLLGRIQVCGCVRGWVGACTCVRMSMCAMCCRLAFTWYPSACGPFCRIRGDRGVGSRRRVSGPTCLRPSTAV